jgi:hypothetical protein
MGFHCSGVFSGMGQHYGVLMVMWHNYGTLMDHAHFLSVIMVKYGQSCHGKS